MRLQIQRLTNDRIALAHVNAFILVIAVLLPFLWLAAGDWTLPAMSALTRVIMVLSRIDVVSLVFLCAFVLSSALLTFRQALSRPEPESKAPGQFAEPKVDFHLLQDDLLTIPGDKPDGTAL